MKRLIWLLSPSLLLALPQGSKVVQGSATLAQGEHELVVTVSSDKAILNHKNFSISEKETVHFVQPRSESVVLNRVTGKEVSQIFGKMHANGKVFLINSNGIVFGPQSQVSVGSLIASTLDIEDTDFMKGKYEFNLHKGARNSQIVNQGSISASPEGAIALIAPHIKNEGVIRTQVGKVAFLAGEKAVIDFVGDGLMSFTVEGELESAIIEHLGTISAPKGEVLLRLKTADRAIKDVINIEGLIEGNTVVKENGAVRIAYKSSIDAAQVSLAGHTVEVLGDVDAKQKFTISARETVRMRNGKPVGDLSIQGKVIALSSPVDARSLQMSAQDHYFLGSDIRVHFGPAIFNAPVTFASQNLHITADQIVFEKNLNCDSRFREGFLRLSAGTGDIVFKGPVGDISRFCTLKIEEAGNVVASGPIVASGIIQNKGIGVATFEAPLDIVGQAGLHLASDMLNLNQEVVVKGGDIQLDTTGPAKIGQMANTQTTGSFTHKGEGELVISGGSIKTGASMHFEGPVRLFDTVTLIAKEGLGDIVFHTNLEGSGGLSVLAGNLDFQGNIGRISPLSMLKANCNSTISVGNIGGAKSGVVGPIELGASDAIVFRGETIRASSQTYKAGKEFRLAAHKPTHFISSYNTAPIVFKKGEVVLENDSHLVVSTRNGDVSIEGLLAEKQNNISIEAGDGAVLAVALKGDIGRLYIAGGKMTVPGTIRAGEATFSSKKEIHLSGDISTTRGDLIFDGPVILDRPNLTFLTGDRGDITFKSSLIGTGTFGAHAKEGTVRFDGPVGDLKHLFSHFVVSSKTIDQNDRVRVTGPINYTGEIHLGGNINITNNPIFFNGPVIRDGADSVIVSATRDNGHIHFESTLDADTPERALILNSGGKTVFKGDIGLTGALGDMTITAASVIFKEIGGEKAGIEGHLQAIASVGSINFLGKVIHAKEQTLTAHEYHFLSGQDTSVITDGQHLLFDQGTIYLKEGTQFAAYSHGGQLKLVGLSAPTFENIVLDAGPGEVHIGSIEDHVGQLSVAGREIYLESKITASGVHMEADQSILQRPKDAKIISSGDVFLNARHGSLGLLGTPLLVDARGSVTVGAHTVAVIEGSSAGGVLNAHKTNSPQQLFFNGNEYFIFSLDDLFDEDEGIISISPDLYTDLRADSIHPSSVRPKRAPLYYQP